MGILKREVTKEENVIEVLAGKLLSERARIDTEKNKIRTRINELIYKPVKENAYRGSFNLEAIEKEAHNEQGAARVKKINMLERVLNQNYLYDDEYRKAAHEYANAIAEDIKRLTEDKENNLVKIRRAAEEAKEMYESLMRANEDLTIASADLLEPLGESVYTQYGEVKGTHVLNKIKNSIHEIDDRG